MTDSVKENMTKLRIQAAAGYFGVLAAAVCAAAGLFIFYEMRLKSLAGAVYLADRQEAEKFFDIVFSADISSENLKAADTAVRSCGYTENGFSYMFGEQGQLWLALIFTAVLGLFIILGIVMYIRMGKSALYCQTEALIKENRIMREELVTNVRHVEKRNRQLQDFIENIAHQVKMPLAGLSLSLDMLRDEWMNGREEKPAGEESEDIFRECFLHISRISEFIRRLLNISRMESGKVIFSHEELELKEMLEEAAESAVSDNVTLELDVPKGCTVNGDRGWLLESFINILGNCDEYIKGRENKKIRINVLDLEDKCIVSISDNGPGFAGGETEKIFDRFETKKDSNSFHVGIGLNLSRLIIEAHHGTIHAYTSDELGGAGFRVVLPRYGLKKGKIITSS